MSEDDNKKSLTGVIVNVLIVLVALFLGTLVILSVIPAILAKVQTSSTKNMCEHAAMAIDLYSKEYLIFPSGSPADIADILRGKNPRGIPFFSAAGSSTGPLLDSWGNPIGYDFSVPGKPRITSAGPDGIMGSSDDITN